VGFYDLQNADPQDVQAALEDLFNRNTRRSSSSQNSRLGDNNPLTRRATQNTQATSGRTVRSTGAATRNTSGGF